MSTITLATLAQATPQQVFDQVAAHLLKQNQKAQFEESTNCKYRAGELKCAAGCLISNDEYNPLMEAGASPYGGGWDTLVFGGVAPEAHKSLIGSLQTVHDACNVEDWNKKLEVVAERYNLVWKH